MTDDPRDPSARRRRRPIKAWRYDEGYGEDRYASPGEASPRRRRRRRSWWRSGPAAELLEVLSLLPRRHPIPCALAAVVGMWLAWPSLQNALRPPLARRPGAPDVITVFVEDPQRTVAALDLWRQRPGSLLVLQGRPGSQAVNLRQLGSRGLQPSDRRDGVVVLTRGCDTLGQLTTLAGYLGKLPRQPGRLTVVTSPAHLERSLAIARIVAGSSGWEVEGVPALTGDNRPESPWRLFRDQARAQFWRLSGWDGSDGTACRARELTERG